ncbi:Uu.00g085540.m01.CDS01 [Anthostomella pinea]|uniref:Uu.00g085540.m01.CDS01 n=1 Tax=Anthostomella pinea TaxID=933095 RepID=A0AAI8YJY1_9PEZI|nr:Uu.00g085540.m01.CDS01 [Anthostomella pinea]
MCFSQYLGFALLALGPALAHVASVHPRTRVQYGKFGMAPKGERLVTTVYSNSILVAIVDSAAGDGNNDKISIAIPYSSGNADWEPKLKTLEERVDDAGWKKKNTKT